MGSFPTYTVMRSAYRPLVVFLIFCVFQLEKVLGGARPRPRPIFVQPQAQERTRAITEPVVDGIHSVERFVGNLFNPIFGGPVASGSNDKEPKDSYGAPSYSSYIEEPKKPKKKEKIPCRGSFPSSLVSWALRCTTNRMEPHKSPSALCHCFH